MNITKVNDRIAELTSFCEEDEDIIPSRNSINAVLDFCQKYSLVQPSIVVFEGNLRLAWKNAQIQISIEFIDNSNLKVVILDHINKNHISKTLEDTDIDLIHKHFISENTELD